MTEEQNSSNPLSLAIKGKRPPRSASGPTSTAAGEAKVEVEDHPQITQIGTDWASPESV